jgi:hypothetical protein
VSSVLRLHWLCADSRHSSNQITARIEKLSYGLDLNYVDPVEYGIWLIGLFLQVLTFIFKRVAQKVVAGVYQGVTTNELDVSLRFLWA